MSTSLNGPLPTNSSIALQTPVGSSDHTASPYSIFWALVAIASASITSPTSLLYSYPHHDIYPANSSPIFCGFGALDALRLFLLDILRQLRILRIQKGHWNFVGILSGIDIRQAAWKGTRLGHRPTLWVGDGDFPVGGDGRKKRKSVMVGIQLLFVLGGFLQGVKLLVIEGIPWTKAWAWLYIISFIFLSALRYISRNEDQEEEPSHQDLCTAIIAHLPILVQIILWRWTTFDLIFSKRIDEGDGPQNEDLVLEYLFLLSFAFIYLNPAAEAIGVVLMVMISFLQFGVAIRYSGPFAFILYFSFLLPPVALYLLRYTGLHRGTVIRDLDNHWSMLVFLSPIINFVFAWLWYTKRYDPSTTYKPGWVDKLG